jgi:hypothetical protein
MAAKRGGPLALAGMQTFPSFFWSFVKYFLQLGKIAIHPTINWTKSQ